MLFVTGTILSLIVVVVLILSSLSPKNNERSPRDWNMLTLESKLLEIDDDFERNLITEEVAKTSKEKINRELLLLERQTSLEVNKKRSKGSISIVGLAVIIPILAFYIHLGVGGSGIPSVSYKDRAAEFKDIKNLEELIEKLSKKLKEDSSGGDPVGWELLGDVYMNNLSYLKATDAYTELVKKKNEDSNSWAKLASALVALEDGVINQAALNAIENSLKIDYLNPTGQYLKALFLEQEGDLGLAYTILANRLEFDKIAMPWTELFVSEVNRLGQILGYDLISLSGEAGVPVTSPDELVSSKTADDATKAFINSMVSNLEERLKTQPNDIDGWLQLVKSYIVLKKGSLAKESLEYVYNLVSELPMSDPRWVIYENLLKELE
jgi:cytochrome c-type biogenesis protein CcmH